MVDVNEEVVTRAVYLYKINFDKAARIAGGSVRYASQHSLLWGAMNPGGHGAFNMENWLGVCAGLAFEWMRRKQRGGDLIALFLSVRNEAFRKTEGPKLEVAGFAGAITASHVRQANISAQIQGQFTQIESRTYAHPYTGFAASLRGGNYYYISSGSHATACRMTPSGGVDFYDPNVGEIAGTSPRFFNTYLRDNVDASALVLELDRDTFRSGKIYTVTVLRPNA